MFERLQKKWKVGGIRLTLILFTFAIGGSATGYVAKKIMNSLAIGEDWLWAVIYILLITIIWPLAVIIISIPFGQFRFFSGYIKKIGQRIGIVRSQESGVGSQEPRNIFTTHHSPLTTHDSRLATQVAIFASGTGSNTQKIIDHFRHKASINIALIVCNNPDAAVLKIAEKENIPALLVNKEKLFRGNSYLNELKERRIDFIVLAGFLWKLPVALIYAYPNRIINIHPALLPKYGGKGMYGDNVHQSVIQAREKESGITIHYVDEHYDNGDIIFQAKCPVLPTDSPGSLAQRIHQLEYAHYPGVIEEVVNKLIS
ncbi:MAG TPA: phosphoribosylglycinamide formyltransferase [Chitinophagaceae bacterium]|nr:phosphoribosylglycinamide formyltransferase [Chitinophagaceae bacterium]